MTALFAIATKYEELLHQSFDEETGEINELALAELQLTKADAKDKAVAVASYIKNLEAERDAIERAKRSMSEREDRLDKRMDYLEEYLQSNMERCGIKEISCPEFVIKLLHNPPSVNPINEEFIPEKYKKVKEVVTLDRLKIKEDILAGIEVPGATLQYRVRLEIR